MAAMPDTMPNEPSSGSSTIREHVHEIHNANNLAMLNNSLLGRIWNDIVPLLESLGKTSPDLKLGNLPLAMVLEEIPLIQKGLEDAADRIRLAAQEVRRIDLLDNPEVNKSAPPSKPAGIAFGPILPTMREANWHLMQEALVRTGQNRSTAASMLDISRQTLLNHIKARKSAGDP
ncbi:MAG: hypothetical protein RL318_1832 [Fibrobacterota bacterium]|jgi:hypothetical protein